MYVCVYACLFLLGVVVYVLDLSSAPELQAQQHTTPPRSEIVLQGSLADLVSFGARAQATTAAGGVCDGAYVGCLASIVNHHLRIPVSGGVSRRIASACVGLHSSISSSSTTRLH